MAYFKIGDTDFSNLVSSLKITKSQKYNSQTNAAGNTVVDLINRKRTIEVEIIPLEEAEAQALLNAVEEFNVSISYREPTTGSLVEGVNCIISSNDIEYYTIQTKTVRLNKFKLKFVEL
jgi:hypothetical protein